MRDDLMTPPAQVLAVIDSLRVEVLRRANARMWQVGSTSTQKAVKLIDARLAARLLEQLFGGRRHGR